MYIKAKKQWDLKPPPPSPKCKLGGQLHKAAVFSGDALPGDRRASGPAACCQLCGDFQVVKNNKILTCSHFSWSLDLGTCAFFGNKTTLMANQGFVSGSLDGNAPPAPPAPSNCSMHNFELDTDYVGHNTINTHGIDAEDCCRQCGNMHDCFYFSFKSGHCYFKDRITGRKKDALVTSGSRGNTTCGGY